ncbi:hypothetical protein lerEdw1_011154 [Lerista edwardsae]|nr:hypothetical protein lerEdw1_011154 [Lerista edwardsae]
MGPLNSSFLSRVWKMPEIPTAAAVSMTVRLVCKYSRPTHGTGVLPQDESTKQIREPMPDFFKDQNEPKGTESTFQDDVWKRFNEMNTNKMVVISVAEHISQTIQILVKGWYPETTTLKDPKGGRDALSTSSDL